MTIAHKNIPEDGLHEPKGASTAADKRVYVANGAGSGSWDRLDADSLDGSITSGTPAGQRVITDGSGGFDSEEVQEPAYGMMNLTGNTSAVSVTAAADSTLATNSDYTEVGLSFLFDHIRRMSTGSNFLEVDNAGVYSINFWANAKSSINANTVAIKFVVNDTDFVTRRPKLQLPNGDELGHVGGNGIHTFSAGDRVKLYIASEKNADITFEDLTFQMNLLELS